MARESQDEHKDRNSTNGRVRLSQNEHDAKLERMSANQREGLARESQDECEARLERSENQRKRESQDECSESRLDRKLEN